VIEMRGIRHEAGGTVILDDVSVSFERNRLHVVLGPNGAGKSTLLRIATGVQRASHGDVRFGDRDLASIPSEMLARERAVLSQHVHMPFSLSVEEVVLMGRYPHFARVARPRDRRIVEQALEETGMIGKRTQAYPSLSGGEQQKVQLARVLAQIWNADEPDSHKHLFLDEPTASLDVHFQIHLLDLAKRLTQRNCTVIAVLHDLNMALQYGDRFVLLDRGRLVHRADSAAAIPTEMIEQTFGVRAHRLADPADGQTVWRFLLPD
jgi:heme transport system ATP-binding protein